MRLLIIRGLALANAIGTVIPVAIGALTDPVFVVADLILAAFLAAAAVAPARIAPMGLLAGSAYAAGVFTIAIGRQFEAGTVNPLLAAALVICAVSLVLLAIPRPVFRLAP